MKRPSDKPERKPPSTADVLKQILPVDGLAKEVVAQLKIDVAMMVYALRMASASAAADMAEIDRFDFTKRLGSYGLNAFRQDPSEVEDDLDAPLPARRGRRVAGGEKISKTPIRPASPAVKKMVKKIQRKRERQAAKDADPPRRRGSRGWTA